MPRFHVLLILTALSLIVVGCDLAEDDPSTWDAIQARILTPHCTEACHEAGAGAARQSDLVLTADVAYDQLVGVPPANPSARADGLLRVSTDGLVGLGKSYLWEKVNVPNQAHYLETHPEYGALMPLGRPALTYGELTVLRQWIEAGAPREGIVADEALLADDQRFDPASFEPLSVPEEGVALRLGPFDVPPGVERELFYYEPLARETDLYVQRVEVSMRPGSHHFLLYTFADGMAPSVLPERRTYRDVWTEDGLIDASVVQPMLYHEFFAGTQWPRLDYTFPEGVALRLPAGKGLDLNAHYVNRGVAPFPGEVHVNLHTVPSEAVERVAEVISLNNTNIELPPQQVTTLERTFTFTEAQDIFLLFSHAHEHMTEFRVERVGGLRDGEEVYYTDDWEHPPIQTYDPPLAIAPGEGLRLIVTYDNDTDRTLRFGLLSEDEMMILFGYAYRDVDAVSAAK